MIKLGSNIASLNAQRRLDTATKSLGSSFERLSSGLRINRASDDAAGLAISESLRADRRVFNQGIRNLNDGMSLLSVADSGLEALTSIATRLNELAEQAANGAYSGIQRKALDTEAQALAKEYQRIIRETKYNGRELLSGSFGNLSLHAGSVANGMVQSGLGGAVGTGTFQSVTSVSTALNTISVELADLNRDGIMDVVSAGYGSTEQFNVSFGVGDGTFGPTVSYVGPGSGYYGLELADVNGDGGIDVLTAGVDGRARVFLNNGSGTFSTGLSYGGVSFGRLSVDDVNGDGIEDMISSGLGTSVQTRLGRGNGTFGGPLLSFSDIGIITISSATGDFNGDGKQDLVVAGNPGTGNGGLSVMLGDGAGRFTATGLIEEVGGGPTYRVSVGDVNGDGILDLASAVDGTSSGFVAIRLGNGDGTFRASTSWNMDASVSNTLSLADLNGDGILDILSSGSVDGFSYRLGQGNGTFGSNVSITTGSSAPGDITTGDVNGDGVTDVVTAGNGVVTTSISQTTGGVSPLQEFSLRNRGDALQALTQFSKAITRLSKQRATIGAFQSRISVGVNVLHSTVENYAAAESQIRDVDIAEEAARLTRTKILQQAAAAVLAQANLQPTFAIKLLKS